MESILGPGEAGHRAHPQTWPSGARAWGLENGDRFGGSGSQGEGRRIRDAKGQALPSWDCLI